MSPHQDSFCPSALSTRPASLGNQLAAAKDRPDRAVRLYARAHALRGSVGTHPSEVAWPDPKTAIAQLRSALSEEAFAEAWTQGLALGLDEALAYALEEETYHQ